MKNHVMFFVLLLLFVVIVQPKSAFPEPPSIPIGPFDITEKSTDEASPIGDNQEPGYNSETLFEGDIRHSGRRAGSEIGEAGTRTPWPKAIIPYVFDCSVLSIASAVKATKAAMQEWESRTCVRFIKKQAHHKVYLEFIRAAGCWATYVGYKGKKTQISIGNGCDYKHVMVHELGHVIGFWHEQSRPDRDNYVRINWNNVIQSLKYNFDIVKEQVNNYGESYDFNSIMHYPFNAFAVDRRQNTILTKDLHLQYTAKPYRELSQSDVTQTKRMYKCNEVTAGRTSIMKSIGEAKRINLASIGGQCQDHHEHCKSWAKAAFCSLAPDPMLTTCPESCGVCSEVCKDDLIDCPAWADYGFCVRPFRNSDHVIKYMLNNCKKSCGVCTPVPTTLPPTTILPLTTTREPTTKVPLTMMRTERPPIITKGGISTPSEKFTGVLCKDRSKYCKDWAKDGRCDTDRWVHDNCLLSCKRFSICDKNIIKPVGRCTDPLGVHDKKIILDNNLYAPSTFMPGGGWSAPASSARLYKEDDHRLKHVGAWCADPRSNRDKYLRIDFGSTKTITALATQGRDVYFEHVKSYSLSFSKDGSSWYDYREGGGKKVFDGNCDHVTPVLNILEKGQDARYIRIHPIKHIAAACLRVEVYGCTRL